MNMKSTALVLTLVLLVMVGIGAAVVSAEETAAGTDCIPVRDQLGRRAGLTEEARAEMEARREAMIESRAKWDALTDEQKDEIYGLEDQIGGLREQMINRYQQWGVIDEDTAAQMQERISQRKTEMREEGRMPMGGGGGFRGRLQRCLPPEADAPVGESE